MLGHHQPIKNPSWREGMILLSFMLFCGLWSIYLGLDLSWDMANYHYYDPYAFLHERRNIDYWPTSFIHLYFNPLADLFSYLLIQSFSPRIVTFLSGAIHGLGLWLAYLIAKRFLILRMDNTSATFFAIALAYLGAYSALMILSIGNLQNDNLAAVFVLAYIYLQLKSFDSFSPSFNKSLALGAFLLGIGIGVKLTTVPYFFGALLALMLTPMPFMTRFRFICIVIIFTGIGAVLTTGYWMLSLWQNYHNPVFPFFNGFFHSPFFTQHNFHYEQYQPPTLWQALYFPLQFSLYGTHFDNNNAGFTDLRFAILYLLVIASGIVYLWRRLHKKKSQPSNTAYSWLLLFSVFSCIIWGYCFSIVRYLAPITLIIPLLIYLLVDNLFQGYYTRAILLFFIYGLMVATLNPVLPMIRSSHYYPTYFNITMPPLATAHSRALVLIAYPAYALSNTPKPQMYLIPFFPTGWQFAGVPFENETHGALSNPEQATLRAMINPFKGRVYLLSSASSMPTLYHIALSLGLKSKGPCEEVKSNRQIMSGVATLICPVGR